MMYALNLYQIRIILNKMMMMTMMMMKEIIIMTQLCITMINKIELMIE